MKDALEIGYRGFGEIACTAAARKASPLSLRSADRCLRSEGFGRRGKESGFGVQGSAIRVQSSGFRKKRKKTAIIVNPLHLSPKPNPCI